MKKAGMLCLLVSLTLGVFHAHALSIEQEINEEARIAMRATGTREYTYGRLVHFVPIGGMTFSNFKGASGNYSFATTTGFDAGLGVLIGRGDLQFETGLMYAERGSKESYKWNFTSWELLYQNKYIELPVMARYNVINNNDVRLYVKAGALMALLQSSQGQVGNTQNYNPQAPVAAYQPYGVNTFNASLVNDNNTKSSFASTDLRWVVGVGGQVRMTKAIAWTLEADYQNSTSPISTTQPDAYYGSTAMDLQMETYGFRTGLVFSL